jgi:hypothetical protein
VTRFSDGRESVTDEQRSGRPATSRIEENIAKSSSNFAQKSSAVGSIAEQANVDRETGKS